MNNGSEIAMNTRRYFVVAVTVVGFTCVNGYAPTVWAACSIWEPDYAEGAAATVVAAAVSAKQQWIDNGCAESIAARQAYFNELYLGCVKSISAPDGLDIESHLPPELVSKNADYQAQLRVCVEQAKQAAEIATLAELIGGSGAMSE
jgi:hypothetical protein